MVILSWRAVCRVRRETIVIAERRKRAVLQRAPRAPAAGELTAGPSSSAVRPAGRCGGVRAAPSSARPSRRRGLDLVAERIDVAVRLGPPPSGDLVRVRLMTPAQGRREGVAAPAALALAAPAARRVALLLGRDDAALAALREALALARVLGAADAQHHLERHLGVPRRLAAERREARVVADLPLALVEARRAEVEDVALGRAQRTAARGGGRARAPVGPPPGGRLPLRLRGRVAAARVGHARQRDDLGHGLRLQPAMRSSVLAAATRSARLQRSSALAAAAWRGVQHSNASDLVAATARTHAGGHVQSLPISISDEMRPEGDKYAAQGSGSGRASVLQAARSQLGLKCRSERCWSERERAANSVHDEAMSASSSSSRCRRLPAPVLQLLQPPAGEAAAAAGGGQPKGRNGRSN